MNRLKKRVNGGIQQKMFSLVFLTILLIIAAFAVVIVWQSFQLRDLVTNTNARQKEAITNTVQQTMDDRLTKDLKTSTQQDAALADAMFADLANSVSMMADYAQKLNANPSAYPAREVALPNAATDGQTTVQLLTESGVNTSDPTIQRQIALFGNMSDLLASLFNHTQIDSCYIALPSGIMILADDHASSKFASDGSIAPIEMTHRPWYTGAAQKHGIYFTDVATDVFTGNVGIMCAMPVYNNDELVAVVGADFLLGDMEKTIATSGEGNDFSCIINDKGHVVFSPKKDGVFKVQESSHAADLRQTRGATGGFVSESLKGTTAPTMVEADGVIYYMCGSPIKTVGWAVVNAVDQQATDAVTARLRSEFDGIVDSAQAEVGESLSRTLVTMIILILAVLGLALTGALVLSRRIVKPLGLITDRVRSLGGDNLRFIMEDEYRTGDEIEVLADSFAKLSAKTLEYVDEVTRVTAEKERIGAELDMATDIQASQLPRLFPAFPNIPEFDIYASMTPAKEVGGDFYDFFLVDDTHIGLVMADVSGKGVPAALFMMVSRVLLKSHLQNGESPSEALESVNDQLCESNEAEFFVTMWVAVIDVATGKGVAANAGHEHPALRRAGGQYELVVYRHSPAVGVMEGIPFREHDFELYPGDSLFVYTDGVPEATSDDEELFGNDRMLEALNKNPDADAKEVLANVTEGIEKFVAGAEQFDDTTMLCVRYLGPDEDEE
ncbi:MAG: SpoIIE family protein phosphatase [Atopobiaceae bacterium]|nr:SpoIIE family protein phosphatase [Atopobiaceae bacterium]